MQPIIFTIKKYYSHVDDKKNALEHLPRMRHTKEREKEEEDEEKLRT